MAGRLLLSRLLPSVALVTGFLLCAGASSAPSAHLLQVALVQDAPASENFETSPLTGLERAVKVLGIHGIALTPTVKEGYAPSFTALALKGFDLVFALGVQEADDLLRVARMFPHRRFAIIDASTDELPAQPRNVLGLVFREQEVGYLVGYLAALMERRRPGRHVVSTVGGFPFIPSVQRYIAGFQAGARKADPRITLLNNYSRDFTDPEACKRVALAQIASGSGVIFQVAGGCGLGALEAAKERHAFGIGVDFDQSNLGHFVLTSALKRWDRVVFQTIRSLQERTLPRRGDLVFDLRDGDLGLGKFSPLVPHGIIRRVEALERAIAANKIHHIPAVPFVH